MDIRYNGRTMPFRIDDDCWSEAGMHKFQPRAEHYPPIEQESVMIVNLLDIEPRIRRQGFNRKRLMRILKGFRTEARIPPIRVVENGGSPKPFRLLDGFHRFFSSAAAGYSHIPVVIERRA